MTAPEARTLTSRQQFTVLDEMIVRALEPIRRETDVFYAWVAEVMHLSIRSRRGNAEDMVRACGMVLTGAPDPVHVLVDGGLDRGHVFTFLGRVHEAGDALRAAELALAAGTPPRQDHLRDLARARRLLGESPRLSPALAASRYWYERAVRWRNDIVHRFEMLLLKGASRMYHGSGGRIEIGPTNHDSWVTAIDTVNRFRSDQSTLAGWLQRSLKGTYRVAASNSLGLAAPGARVSSEDALQTTTLDAALDPASEVTRLTVWSGKSVEDGDEQALLRAVALVARDPDVRAALLVGDASPVEALAALGLGPLGKAVATSEETSRHARL